MYAGLTEGVLLIALALGYIVCYLANREEKNLRSLGYLVGLFIIIFSAMVIAANVLFSAKMCGSMAKMRKMGMPQHKMMMQQRVATPQAPTK